MDGTADGNKMCGAQDASTGGYGRLWVLNCCNDLPVINASMQPGVGVRKVQAIQLPLVATRKASL